MIVISDTWQNWKQETFLWACLQELKITHANDLFALVFHHCYINRIGTWRMQCLLRMEFQYLYLDLQAHQLNRKQQSNLCFYMKEITLKRCISMKHVTEFESCCNISYFVNIIDKAHKPITIKTPLYTITIGRVPLYPFTNWC